MTIGRLDRVIFDAGQRVGGNYDAGNSSVSVAALNAKRTAYGVAITGKTDGNTRVVSDAPRVDWHSKTVTVGLATREEPRLARAGSESFEIPVPLPMLLRKPGTWRVVLESTEDLAPLKAVAIKVG